MKEAMEQVKKELGPDAVILHTKKYREGGILGFNAREVVEVTAALEEEPPKEKTAPRPRLDVVSKPETTAVPPVTPARKNAALRQYQETTAGTKPAKVKAGAKPQPQTVEQAAREAAKEKAAAQARFDALVQKLAEGAPDPKKKNEKGETKQAEKTAKKKQGGEEENDVAAEAEAKKIKALEDELAQMKSLLAQVMTKDQPKGVRTLQDALGEQEVKDEILKSLAGSAAAGETLLDSLTPEAHSVLAKFLAEKVQFADGIRLNPHGSRVVALIGPTGVGKTTSLAKIAARFVLEKGIDAALITADTYRISAVEQLKTYSDIIGLPLEIVYTPQELRTAIHKFRQKDLVLIDTAGRSQHNEFQMKELVDFLDVSPNIERHLVLSATTKSRDAEDILEKFSVCDPDCVIFTKTDETASLGLMLNLLYEKDIKLSFFTNGQSVPDDITQATPEALADLLLRE